MENKKIIVIFGEGIENVEISSNTPDISNLVKTISANRTTLLSSKILVTCDDDDFDADGFLHILKKVIDDFLSNIVIETTKYRDVIDQIEKIRTEKASAK